MCLIWIQKRNKTCRQNDDTRIPQSAPRLLRKLHRSVPGATGAWCALWLELVTYSLIIISYYKCHMYILSNKLLLPRSKPRVPDGLGVRISGFHPDGPGSIPGLGGHFANKRTWFLGATMSATLSTTFWSSSSVDQSHILGKRMSITQCVTSKRKSEQRLSWLKSVRGILRYRASVLIGRPPPLAHWKEISHWRTEMLPIS